METIKGLMMLSFTLFFIAITMYFGKYYNNFHVSQHTWITITGLFGLATFVLFIIDIIKGEKEDETS